MPTALSQPVPSFQQHARIPHLCGCRLVSPCPCSAEGRILRPPVHQGIRRLLFLSICREEVTKAGLDLLHALHMEAGGGERKGKDGSRGLVSKKGAGLLHHPAPPAHLWQHDWGPHAHLTGIHIVHDTLWGAVVEIFKEDLLGQRGHGKKPCFVTLSPALQHALHTMYRALLAEIFPAVKRQLEGKSDGAADFSSLATECEMGGRKAPAVQ